MNEIESRRGTEILRILFILFNRYVALSSFQTLLQSALKNINL